jgi:hypothetical protein
MAIVNGGLLLFPQFYFETFTNPERTSEIMYLTSGLETDPKHKMKFSRTLDHPLANMTRILAEDYV